MDDKTNMQFIEALLIIICVLLIFQMMLQIFHIIVLR